MPMPHSNDSLVLDYHGQVLTTLKKVYFTPLVSESFEKVSFLKRFVMGLAQFLSGTPHFMSTISTMQDPFLSCFLLLGLPPPSTDTLSE